MVDVKRCPYCAEQILAEAIKCRHCGEFLDGCRRTLSRTGQPASIPTGSAPAKGDNTITIVVVVMLGVALVVGLILFAVLYGITQGQSDGSSQPAQAPFAIQDRSGAEHPAQSTAYKRGRDLGVWVGDLDRNHASYDGLTLDEAEKLNWASTYQYKSGTPEYGDFWAGYDAGYLESRQ